MTPRVLIADDSLTVRMDLEETFQGAGFETTVCSKLAAVREALAGGKHDLLVLDLLFPDGNGIDFLEELRRSPQNAAVPVIFLSTRAAVADRIRGLQAGAHDYAGKPYDRAYLVSRARELLASGEQGGSPPKGFSVLVIEDSATCRQELRETLEAEGYGVIEAPTGEDGLRQAALARPSAVLVDGLLPDIEGATVIQRLRLDPALRATPCLLLTASLDREQELRALAAGADGCLRKDQGTGLLLARLAGVLRREESPRSEEKSASLFGPKKILAVDDSETYLQALASELRADGYDIVTAHSGREAMDLLAVEAVDCILLDVIMPGLSGQETCQRIKLSPAWREIPVLLLTAKEDRETMLEGINAGADDYISKSSDFDIVRARVRAQLRRKHFEAENRRIHDELHRKELEASQERAARILAEHRGELLDALELKTRALQESEERLARIVETIAEAIFIVERSGRVTFANAAAEKLFQLKREAITARTHDDPAWKQTAPGGIPFAPEDLPFNQVMRTREPVNGIEVEVERAGGSRLVVSINAAPLTDPAGEVVGMVASLVDITHRKEVERMKDEFVSTVSHELRTPLSCLRGFTELMLTRDFPQEKQREFLGIIKEESVRLANLINDFLDIQRMESGRQRYELKAVDVAALLKDAQSLFREAAGGNRIRLEVPAGVPPVWADADRIHQVLSNLISNALKFSPRGGEVTVGARGEGKEVEIRVEDQGIGMSPQTVPHLFTKFFRVDSKETRGIKGTGLGLALVKEIVTAHRGRLWVKSEPGKGSTFYFSLPAAE
jgi:PAS domain S-box-containing protein